MSMSIQFLNQAAIKTSFCSCCPLYRVCLNVCINNYNNVSVIFQFIIRSITMRTICFMKHGESLIFDITVSAGLSARLGGDKPTDIQIRNHIFQSFNNPLTVSNKLLNSWVFGYLLCMHHWLGLGTKQKLEMQG